MTRRVVALADRASLAEGGERLLSVASLLVRRGLDVELLVPAFGPDLGEFRRTAPTWVIQGLRPQNIRPRPPVVRGDRRILGSRALRRWLRARSGSAFLVLDPTPIAIVQHLPEDAGPIVGVLPDPWSTPSSPVGGAFDDRVRSWLTFTGDQAEDVRRSSGADATAVGPIPLGSSRFHLRGPAPGSGAIVLLVGQDRWSRVDHAVEVAWKLASRVPGHEVRWVGAGSDRWTCEHDLRHAGLHPRIQVSDLDDPDALDGAGVVVRTDYGASTVGPLVAAGLAGIPATSFATEDVPSPLAQHEVLDVDGLVDDLATLVADPSLARERGAKLAAELSATPFREIGGRLIELLAR